MILDYLDAKHDSYDAERWADNRAIYTGGAEFRARIARFLPRRPKEPQDQYGDRQREACYRPYVGSIVDYFTAWLFSASFSVRAQNKKTGKQIDEVDEFYGRWKEDVGEDQDITEFMRDRFTDALQTGCSYWLVEFPDPGDTTNLSRADYDNLGLGHPALCRLSRDQIYDWECDGDGNYIWAIVHGISKIRTDPRMGKRDTYIETWELYDSEFVELYEIQWKEGQRPVGTTNIPPKSRRRHGARQVPIVEFEIPPGLAVVERVKEAQIAQFRLSSALDWGIKQTCYATPIFKLEDAAKPPVMGTGYYMMIGKEEDVVWIAPPTDHLDVTAQEKESAREEIYRITHQLALSVNNREPGAVSRSGESKEQDALSTRVMLNAYGSLVKEALEETYEIVSDARGDVEVTFSVEGYDSFDTQAVGVLLANTQLVKDLAIPSKTVTKEIFKRAALAAMPDADQSVKDVVRDEIDKGVDEMPDPVEAENARLHAMASGLAGTPDGSKKPSGNRAAGGSQPTETAGGGSRRAASGSSTA